MRLKAVISVFSCVLMALCVSRESYAQTLPALPADPVIKHGSMPDGVSYYMCPNTSGKGRVSIALVQRMDASLTDDQLYEVGRRRLSKVRFDNTDLHSFLARSGVTMDRMGIVRASQGSVEYHFNNLHVSYGLPVLDSALFAVFSLIAHSSSEGQPSSSQALVVSGDFNPSSLTDKMKLLSIMCPASPGDIPAAEYEWHPRDDSHSLGKVNPPLSGWYVEWTSPRVPRSDMPTVWPVIQDKMSMELGEVLKDRLYDAFRAKGHYVWITFSHAGSESKAGDEVCRLSVHCAKSVMDEVREIMEREICRLRTWGVTMEEYVLARDCYRWKWFAQSRLPVKDNAMYILRCRNNFLFGAPLASEDQRMASVYKDMPDSTQTRLFNSFARELVGQTAPADYNVRMLHRDLQNDETERALAKYTPGRPLKMPKDKNEFMTKGMIWTYSNGVNVIYRQLETRGMTYYCYGARGGRQYADEDYLHGIDGVYDEQFNTYLESKGIELNVEFYPTDVRLKGLVPTQNMENMLRAVVAVASQPENSKVFGEGTYKLFVMVGDAPYEKVKNLMRYYADALGTGRKWLPGTAVEQDITEQRWFARAQTLDFMFHLDLSATNYALQNVARIILQSALAEEFAMCATAVRVEGAFQGFPTDLYRLTIGAEAVPVRSFPIGCAELSSDQMKTRMKKVMYRLSKTPLDDAVLARYKAAASDAFKSYRETPQYYMEMALDRYLNNRNLTSRYDVSLRLVTSETVRQFFENAYSSYSD